MITVNQSFKRILRNQFTSSQTQIFPHKYSGNGMECCYPPISTLMKTFPEEWIKFQLHEQNSGDQKSGFGSYILNETHAKIRMHDDQGKVLHEFVKPSRKHSS